MNQQVGSPESPPPTVSYHSAKFSGHRYYESADVSFFYFSCDYVFKRSRDVTLVLGCPHCKLPLCQVWWPQVLPKFRYKVLLLSSDHAIETSRDLEDAVPSLKSPPYSILVVLGLAVKKREDVTFPFPIPIPMPISMFANYQHSA